MSVRRACAPKKDLTPHPDPKNILLGTQKAKNYLKKQKIKKSEIKQILQIESYQPWEKCQIDL